MPFRVWSREINYPEVNTFADLPDVSENMGEIYLVLTTTGIWGINRKRRGLWRSDGVDWNRLGVAPTLVDLGGMPGTSGTSLPESANDGDLFYETDENRLYIWKD